MPRISTITFTFMLITAPQPATAYCGNSVPEGIPEIAETPVVDSPQPIVAAPIETPAERALARPTSYFPDASEESRPLPAARRAPPTAYFPDVSAR